MNIEGTYKFPNQTDITFTDPTIEISPIVRSVNPEGMTINVEVYIPMEGSAKGKFYVDINPVPVVNLDYNEGELVTRILTRFEDFKI
jgi:hypothetical protein